jgi:thioredoxin-related protein
MTSKISRKYLLTLLLLPLFMGTRPNTAVVFTASNWETAKEEAKTANKFFFVDFDASYCSASRTMDETTYQDARLARYMKDKVVAQKLDIQDFEGIRLSGVYEVEALPTMLIFAPNGKFLKRLEGYQSADDILTIMLGLERELRGDAPAAGIAQVGSNTKTTDKSPAPGLPGSSKTVSTPDERPNVASNPEIFEFDIKRVEAKGFTVQIGVFGDYGNILFEAEKLRKKFSEQVMVQLDRVEDKSVYRLYLGKFPDRKSADAFRVSARSKGANGIVKEL